MEPDSPASTSGLHVGDLIVNVDGVDTSKFSAEATAALLRGKEGTKASVRVIPYTASEFMKGGELIANSGNLLDFKDYQIIRKPIKIQGVTSTLAKVNNKEVGIVKVKSFSTSTETAIAKALDDLYK